MTEVETLTLVIAGYAAAVSTFVLGWDVYKWLSSGPKITISASPNMQIVGGLKPDPKSYVSVRAVNTGDRATTITNLCIDYYRRWWSAYLPWVGADIGMFVSSPSSAQPIPYRFEPGDQWTGLIEQTKELNDRMESGYLFAVVYDAHGGRGTRCRIQHRKSKHKPAKPQAAA